MAIKLNTTLDEVGHYNRLERYSKRVKSIYDQALKEFLHIAETLNIDTDKLFSFAQYPKAKKRVADLITKIVGEVSSTIRYGILMEWEAANKQNDALVNRIFHIRNNKDGSKYARYKSRNNEALKQFETRKVGGLGLSDRIWQNTQQFKQELEMALDVGIGDGKSAASLSRDVRKYLNDPDKLFRRVRDKHGQLQLSKAAEAYHPGQGKYRSSYKNAMRLTRTETNMAYRSSDHERWKEMDFIVGFEVNLSNANKHCPLCEELAGRYPKDFKFVGWHPHCMCYVTSIMATDKEMYAIEDSILNDETVNVNSVNEVKDLPDKFKNWVENNKEKINNAKSLPYFIRDNADLI